MVGNQYKYMIKYAAPADSNRSLTPVILLAPVSWLLTPESRRLGIIPRPKLEYRIQLRRPLCYKLLWLEISIYRNILGIHSYKKECYTSYKS